MRMRSERVQAFAALCRQRRLPLTVQRRAVLEALLERDDHPSADDLYAALRARVPGISRTTVYRVLETLVELGLAARVSHPGSSARYDALTERHHHLVCQRCDRLMDLVDPALDALPVPATPGFEIADYSIHFRGVCAACRRAAGRSTRRLAATAPRRHRQPERGGTP